MSEVALNIADLHPDPQVAERLRTGRFRINQELNQEWIDLQNDGPYVLNLQGRVLACMSRQGLRHAPMGFRPLRHAVIQSPSPIALASGHKVRIFTGEQPRVSTHIPDQARVQRVLWLVQSSYLWLPEGQEAHIYLSLGALRQQQKPLARYILR